MSQPALQVWFDPVCPWCFIGYSRLYRARTAIGARPVTIDWRPFQLSPNVSSQGVPRDAYFAEKFGGADRAAAAWARVSAAGTADGVVFAFDNMPVEPNTLNAHRAVRYAKASGHDFAFVGGLFVGHFQRGQNIGSIDTLAGIANEVGMKSAELHTFLRSTDDVEATQEEALRSRQLGINSVPSYGLGDHLISAEQAIKLF